MRALYADRWDDAGVVLTPTTEASSFPVANTQDARLSRVWRTTTAASVQRVVLDAGAPISVDTVAILGHNITAAATITLEGNATDSWGAPTVSETVAHQPGVMLHAFTSASLRYWRLSVTDTGNPAGFIEIGRVMLGLRVQLGVDGRSTVLEWPVTHVSGDRQTFAQSGELYADRGVPFRTYAYEFRAGREALKDTFQALAAAVGRSQAFVFTNYDAPAQWGITEPVYVTLAGDITFNWLGHNRWTWRFQLREVR